MLPSRTHVVFTPNHYTDKLYNAFVQDEIPMLEETSFH